MVSQATQAVGEKKLEAGGCKAKDNSHISVPYSGSLETDGGKIGSNSNYVSANAPARPSNLRLLSPSDASPSAATPSSGSSTPEVFYDAVDVLPLATLTCHGWGHEDVYHDASTIPHHVAQVNTNYSQDDQNGEATQMTQVEDKVVARTSRYGMCDLSDDSSSWWGRNSPDKSSWEAEDPNKGLPGLPPSGLSSNSTKPAEKPRVRRPLLDAFVPYQYRLEDSNLNEETRKIVQMLANDRICKIDRPALGLQDRLQNLAKCTAGKKTSYVKGPRVCSTLVKGIIKRSHDTMIQGRQNTNNREQSAHTNRETSPGNWSIVKNGKKKKINDGNTTDICNKAAKPAGESNAINKIQSDYDAVVGFSASPSKCSATKADNSTSTHSIGSEVHGTTTKLPEDCSNMANQPYIDTKKDKLSYPDTVYSHVPETLTEKLSIESVHTKRQKLDEASKTCNDNFSKTSESKQLIDHYQPIQANKHKLSKVTDYRDDNADIFPEDQKLTNASYLLKEKMRLDLSSETAIPSTCQPYASDEQRCSSRERAQQASQNMNKNLGCALDLQAHIAPLHKVSHKLTSKMDITQRRNKEGETVDKINEAEYGDIENMETHGREKITNKDINSRKSSVTSESPLPSNTLKEASSMIQQVQMNQFSHTEGVNSQKDSKEISKMTRFRATEICLLSSNKVHHSCQESAVKAASPMVKLQTDAISRLKTDNLVARYGGNKRLSLLLPTLQPHPAPDKDSTTDPAPPPDSLKLKKHTRPPKPPLSRQCSKEEKPMKGQKRESIASPDKLAFRRLSHVKQASSCSSRRGSLESRRGSRCSHFSSSPSTSLRGSFSQDLLKKCLEVAVNKCYNVDQEEQAEEAPNELAQLSQEELDKALKKAVCYHDADKARRLLQFGADPNVRCGQTGALLRAAREGALYVVQALLAAGADVDARTEQGNSALHLAAREGFSEVAVQLVHSGAFVDAINRSGVTPLQVALAHGHLDVAYSLLRLSADIFLKNKAGESAYDVANYLGYIGLCTDPKERRRDSAPGTVVEGQTREVPQAVKMIRGIEDGCAATVQDCLLAGARVDTMVPLALHYPAQATVLHRAAHHGSDLIVRLLLASGALVNAQDSVGNTPLHAAAQAGHNYVIKLLLKSGADMEAVSQSGMTPLHRAASKGKELTCNLLVRRGGSVYATDDEGRTPADWARKRGFKQLARKLAVRRKSSATLEAQANAATCLSHLHHLHQQALLTHQHSQCEE